MKKVVDGVSSWQPVLTWPSWAYQDVKSQWTQVLPCSSIAHLLWLKTTGVSLTPTKCTPCVLVIIDPCSCGFARAFEHLSFICFAESLMSKLTPHWSLVLPTSSTRFGWSLIDSRNPLTSYSSTPATMSRRRSLLIEGHSLFLTFGSNCMCPSGLTWFIVHPITFRQMAKLSE
jgi:hypothetical protein